ncbi:MAG: succinyl-diaminopimelate desuccinylase [Magnetococcales bacterium]|nr:succinyl-diaminopimelate desuccinylase [Magnetococcales bacterium]NGZ26874.1 succinyl-diaminopimelate desuccinylase [Magnetococcales bacterium]
MKGDSVSLLQQLIQAKSVTPVDDGCQRILQDRLTALGFTIYPLTFGPVQNFYARLGAQSPNLCMAGHTDVVPTGPESQWSLPPFAGEIRDERIYGRGACDMKGGLAAMVAAVERFLQQSPTFPGSISFLVTGDEEADAVDGTVKVVEWLAQRGEKLDYCLLSEPTGQSMAGDCVKNGRRGSVNGTLTIFGKQGHVAHPHLADNPIHKAMPILDRLARLPLDEGNAHFPPSCLQLTSLKAGAGATNVIPALVEVAFNIRFCTENTPQSLETLVRQTLDASGAQYQLEMKTSALPFLAPTGALLANVERAILQETGQKPHLSTSGGTSDARFIAPYCPQTLELGVTNNSAHHVDEYVTLDDLDRLTRIYTSILKNIFLPV